MQIVISSQSDSGVLQSVLAFGTALAGIGSCLAAYLTYRAIRRQEKRDRPLAAIRRADAESGIEGAAVIVANTGAITFTVIEVGIGDRPFRYFDYMGLAVELHKNRRGTRTITPGDHARFPITHGGGGLAYAKLADGTVFREKTEEQ